MYYFDILAVLEQKKGEKLSSREIYVEIAKRKGKANLNQIQQVLFKMFIRNDKVHRQTRINSYKPYNSEFVYFVKS